MRIAYLMNEMPGAATEMNCARVYADTDKTDRQELHYLINKGGLVSGDVLCVRQISDFGRGKQSSRIKGQIEAMGVSIELHPTKQKRVARGRPRGIDESSLTDDQYAEMQNVWHRSVYGETRALERLSEIYGSKVTKSNAVTLLGNRGDKPKKRKAK